MRDKFELLILRYLLLLAALLGCYTLLNYAFFQPGGRFPLQQIVRTYYLPLLLSVLAAWVFLNPRLKILDLKVDNGRFALLYLFAAAFTIGFTLMKAQEYMESASGIQTPLSSMEAIRKAPNTRYYTVRDYFISKAHASAYSEANLMGRRKKSLQITVFVAVPMMAAVEDTSIRVPAAWLGTTYQKTISDQLSEPEMQEAINAFIDQTLREVASTDLSGYIAFERLGPSDDREAYRKACEANRWYRSNDIILTAMKESPAAQGRSQRVAFLWAIVILPGIWILMTFIPSLDQRQVDRIRAGRPERRNWRFWR